MFVKGAAISDIAKVDSAIFNRSKVEELPLLVSPVLNKLEREALISYNWSQLSKISLDGSD